MGPPRPRKDIPSTQLVLIELTMGTEDPDQDPQVIKHALRYLCGAWRWRIMDKKALIAVTRSCECVQIYL